MRSLLWAQTQLDALSALFDNRVWKNDEVVAAAARSDPTNHPVGVRLLLRAGGNGFSQRRRARSGGRPLGAGARVYANGPAVCCYLLHQLSRPAAAGGAGSAAPKREMESVPVAAVAAAALPRDGPMHGVRRMLVGAADEGATTRVEGASDAVTAKADVDGGVSAGAGAGVKGGVVAGLLVASGCDAQRPGGRQVQVRGRRHV